METLQNTAFPVESDVIFRDDVMKSREKVTVKAGSGAVRQLLLGTVLGMILLGAATVGAAEAVGTNTGTGTFGAITADAGAPAGDYFVVVIEPASNAGAFLVYKPDGTLDGRGTVAVAYNGTINFTLADATDFAAGDAFKINVSYAAGSGKVVALDPEATDGSQIAYGVLATNTTAGDGTDAEGVAVVRDAILVADGLIWPDEVDADYKAAEIVRLAANQIVLR